MPLSKHINKYNKLLVDDNLIVMFWRLHAGILMFNRFASFWRKGYQKPREESPERLLLKLQARILLDDNFFALLAFK